MARTDEFRAATALPASGSTYTLAQDTPARVINLHEPKEVSAWTHVLGCSEEVLRRAIAAVGPEVDEVCNHLGALLPAQALHRVAGNRTAH